MSDQETRRLERASHQAALVALAAARREQPTTDRTLWLAADGLACALGGGAAPAICEASEALRRALLGSVTTGGWWRWTEALRLAVEAALEEQRRHPW